MSKAKKTAVNLASDMLAEELLSLLMAHDEGLSDDKVRQNFGVR
jgi:hypothetical protein